LHIYFAIFDFAPRIQENQAYSYLGLKHHVVQYFPEIKILKHY